MSNITKHVISAAFEHLLERKPLEKITVKDIVKEAEVNRQTFYYHFKDIFDLIEWIFQDEAERILSNDNEQTWEQRLLEAFTCIQGHRLLILNVFHSPSRDDLDQFIHKVSHPLFVELVATSGRNKEANEQDRALIAWFYTYAITGMVLDWVRNNMKEDPMELVLSIANLITWDLTFDLKLGPPLSQ